MDIFSRKGRGRPRKVLDLSDDAPESKVASDQHDGNRQTRGTGINSQANVVGEGESFSVSKWDEFVAAVRKAKNPIKAYCPEPKCDSIDGIPIFRGEYCYIDMYRNRRGLGMTMD